MQTLPGSRQRKPAEEGCAPSTRRALAAAFASFTQSAGALEATYARLQSEVSRLRYELECKNRCLTESLEENQRTRAYLAAILEGLPCGVLVLGPGGTLRSINPAACRLLDPTHSSALSSGGPVPARLATLLARLPVGAPPSEQEWLLEGGEGGRTVGVARAPLVTSGASEDSVVILRDLTEAKELERQREAARRSQALAEITALLAHEIRNPLASLELFAGLLADALAHQPELRSWVNHLQAGLRVLAATVNNVMHFHGQPPAQLHPANLVEVVRQAVEFLRPLAQEKEMHIVCEAPESSLPIRADPARLHQAFFNLGLNAFRAMQVGGTLRVKVAAGTGDAGAEASVAFEDNGAGISAQNLARVFEPGFTTHPGSPGFGLPVARKVIEQHGGEIRVESRENQGTSFTVTLPLAVEALPANSPLARSGVTA